MSNTVDVILSRMVARGGEPFRTVPEGRGPYVMLRRLLGLAPRTRCYDRLDGSRVLLTEQEASEIAPIELELASAKVARRVMLERRQRRTD
jgi:hypothetical protein